MPSSIDLTRDYLDALERFDGARLAALLADDVVQHEFPSRLMPNGAVHDRASMLQAFERGKTTLRSQRYELVHALEGVDEVAFEAIWTGVLAIPIGALQPGDSMRARFAIFLAFRDGKIRSIRNYDCFDPI